MSRRIATSSLSKDNFHSYARGGFIMELKTLWRRTFAGWNAGFRNDNVRSIHAPFCIEYQIASCRCNASDGVTSIQRPMPLCLCRIWHLWSAAVANAEEARVHHTIQMFKDQNTSRWALIMHQSGEEQEMNRVFTIYMNCRRCSHQTN